MIVTKSHHKEVVAAKDEQIVELKARVAQLEDERRKYIDVLAYSGIRATIFDKTLFAKDWPEDEPMTEDQRTEAEFEEKRDDLKNKLTSIARTRPSQIGAAMSSIIQKERTERERAAHPPVKIAAAFEQADQELSNP